jgi:glucose-6-phosphate isomerase
MDVTMLDSWDRLSKHYENEIENRSLQDIFLSEGTRRFKRCSVRVNSVSEKSRILFDYSKNHVTEKTMQLLFKLLKEAGFERKRGHLLSATPFNNTENRPVLHHLLRDKSKASDMYVDKENVTLNIRSSLEKMRDFSRKIRRGIYKGATDKAITDVVHIGIGGSYLGPRMVVDALQDYAENLAGRKNSVNVHFVSNVDSSNLFSVLNDLNPETTLFIIVSKTFTTDETLTNALSAKRWLEEKLDKASVIKHFVAVTSHVENVHNLGISEQNVFKFPDWVGGRFSLWSAVGLSIAIAIGMDNFEKLLDGAYAADKHFLSAEMEQNIPVIMAVLGIWYNNFFYADTHAVLPYDNHLKLLPAYLQQLEMESNGKSVCKDGSHVKVQTCPIIFGGAGTDVQHSFFQLLHQGTHLVPCDFIVAATPIKEVGEHHKKLLANFLAQTQALMMGKDDKNEPHKYFEGNRPSNSIIMNQLTPYNLGMLLAFYEHKVFVQGVLWDVNSYDQWGVELGKQLAKEILPVIDNTKHEIDADDSTQSLLKAINIMRDS